MDLFSWQTISVYVFIVLRVLVIAGIGFFVAQYVKNYIMRKAQQLPQEALRISLLARIAMYAIYSVVGLIVMREVGIQTTLLMSVVGIAGIAFGLAIKDSLANILSGIFLMVEHPYEQGDRITVEGLTGIVVEITFYATMLQASDGTLVRIPHDKLIKNSIIIAKK